MFSARFVAFLRFFLEAQRWLQSLLLITRIHNGTAVNVTLGGSKSSGRSLTPPSRDSATFRVGVGSCPLSLWDLAARC